MHLVKLVVLGAPGVGKTSLIEHFLDDDHALLDRAPDNVYTVTVVVNEIIYQLKIVDMPAISYFPGSAFLEWTDYRGCALRSAHGYLLVFDLASPGTFQYLKVIREQLFESRNMQNVPVYVVGNKADLCSGVLASLRGSQHHGHHHHPHLPHSHHHHHQLSHHSHDQDLTPAFKDLAQMVRKQWKSFYTECSAKYNWRVVPIFKELFKAIEASQFKTLETSTHHHRSKDHGHAEHRESLKSWTLNATTSATTSAAAGTTAQQRGASNSRTSNNQTSLRRGSHSCHLL